LVTFARRSRALDCVKFNLIDKIEQLSDHRIVAVKNVSLAEEYLADHFPTFPVLPGVLMVEAAVQAAGWLLHHRNRFAKSMAVLKEARNVKYGQFVAPGNFLRMEVELVKPTDAGASFKAIGTVGQAQAVQMRLELAYFNLADKNPALAETDTRLIEDHRRRWDLLCANSPGIGATVEI
jgi:3-hydroxyacyl-[acyl-carrier-protein] dehydratase